ncbi:hypothetical protein BGZ54_008620 [Gamsiella multidivaricata]|nr:hypothetical protein BGZ54_008620 [Gamsiella multidivaricata]
MSSYFGDQSQYESHQSPENQQQQPYDPAFGQYLDQQSSPSDQSNYIPEPAPVAPEPERINDSLNRHLGYPIVAFGFGGNIVSWFPCTQHNHDSRALKVQKISDLIPVDTVIANYPGPLLNDSSVQLKNKRKELLKLIEDKISELGQAQDKGIFDAHRVLIWKLFKVMFEQDGTLVGGSKIDEAVKIVLASIPITKIPLPSIHQKSAEEISASVDALQEILRQGDLAASVRHAIESHLWAHALVISSHGDRELWKEAVNGFVSHELSGQDGLHANGRASLRVLYSLFSGQSEKAALELIPQDLRAQYLENTSDLSTQTKIPPESLVQWRDTLILILSNRTEGDQATINALGNLLMKEGWVEAAHICYLLSPQFSVHSGPDTSHVSMVLLGASHSPHTIYPYYKNVESFQKTEIYEFGCALKSSGATGGLPFLQAYKLIYIWSLLDQGMFSEVARYLESVEMIVKSQTKGSPYYNSTFHAQLNDAIERLAGSVHAAHAGPWLSKKTPQPTTDTVFNAFKSESMEHNARAHDQAQHATSVENSLSVDPSPQILAGQTHRVDPSPVAAGAEAGSEDQHYDGDNAKSHILTDPNMGYEHGEQGHAYDAFQQYGADYGQASTGEHQDHEQQSQSAVYYGGEQGEQEQNQTYAQYDTLNASHDHHDDNTSAVPNSVLSTQAVAGSVQRSPEDLHGTVLGHEMQDSEFDGGYAPYSEGSYDVTRQDTAVYQDGEYQEQQPHVEAEQAHENTSTYDVSNQYYHQDQEPYQANLDYTTDQDLGAQYTDPNPRRADDYTHVQTSQQDQHDAAPHTDAASADEPTMEQQAAHAPEDDQKYAIQDKQYHQGQDPQTAKHGSELQHSGYEGADHDNASFQQQGGYDPQGYSYEGHHQDAEHQQGQYPQGEYQQSSYHEGGYQQGDYAQVSHQGGEYQNNDYQTGNNQQEDYQQGGYHQGDYQQGNYHQGEYQQGEYQSGQYQQYQEGDYTQAEHQHDVFSTSDYQSNDNNQQQGHLYATQSSTEPGVLPVSSEEDPSTAEFAPAATTGTVQDLQEGDYEEGQFVSFGAIPSFPTFGGQQQNKQVATSTSQQPDRQTAGEDVDDLGMGNQSLRREKITASAPPAEGSISASHGQQSAGTDGQPGQGSEEAGSGWWPVINLFGSEKREPTPKPAKANLSEGSTFYFDNELQRWVNKSAPDSQTSTEPLPPPPKVRAPASPSTPGLSGPPGLPGPLRPTGAAGGPPLPQARPAGGSTVRRGARARYVDVLNP